MQISPGVIAVELSGFFQLLVTDTASGLRAIRIRYPLAAFILAGELRRAVGWRLGRWLIEDAAGRRIIGSTLAAGALVDDLTVNRVQVFSGGRFQKPITAFDLRSAVVEAATFTDGSWRQRRRYRRI